jgi:hypothetical protein
LPAYARASARSRERRGVSRTVCGTLAAWGDGGFEQGTLTRARRRRGTSLAIFELIRMSDC